VSAAELSYIERIQRVVDKQVHSTVKRLILHSENYILRVTDDPTLRYQFSDTFSAKYWRKHMYTFPQTSWDNIRGPSIFHQKSVSISLASAISSSSSVHDLKHNLFVQITAHTNPLLSISPYRIFLICGNSPLERLPG
jgi:hypothetical protein